MFLCKKKPDKQAWATLVYGASPKNIDAESEERLSALTTLALTQRRRIMDDSVRIALSTKNQETRASRITLCHSLCQEMLQFKPFCSRDQLTLLRQAEALLRKLPK